MEFDKDSIRKREDLWANNTDKYNELLNRSKEGERSHLLEPPQGTASIPALRFATMNLGGFGSKFKTSQQGQKQYQVEFIQQVVSLIWPEGQERQHIVVLTEINAFWFSFLKDEIPGWRFTHDGRGSAIMYDYTVCTCIDFKVKHILPDDDPDSKNIKYRWRTILWAVFDVGEYHPYHLVTTGHVIAGSHCSDAETTRIPIQKIFP